MTGLQLSSGVSCEIKIDNEFRNLVPAISDEERSQLEANIVEHGGARDPLTVWLRSDDDFVLLDGHNRHEICTRLGLPFTTHQVDLNTRDEAADWIDRNQLGRRNLSRQDYKLLLGRRYNRAKKQGERTDITSGKSCQKSTTAERLAKEHGVTEKTVRNAGKFQAAAATLGIEKEIAAGKVKASEAVVVQAAAQLPENPTPDDIRQASESVKASGTKSRKSRQSTKPTAADTRRKNGKLAHKLTLTLISLRNYVEALSQTNSAYRSEAAMELQRYAGHLSRIAAGDAGKPRKTQASDELRAAVHARWDAMRVCDKQWGIADMPEVRRLFIEVIRKEQKQVGS